MNQRWISHKTQKLLAQHGLKLKKSLGQNFVTDPQVIQQIIDAADISSQTGIIEIGPGIGALTEKLAEQGKQVIAVELDQRLLPVLRALFDDQAHVKFIHGDALKMNYHKLMKEFINVQEINVVANLPYYITSPLLIHLLQNRYPFKRIVVMVQKEVADRLIASPGSKAYGSISLFAQYFTKVEKVFTVPRNVFFPRPQVDSAVVKFDIRSEPAVKVRDESLFFRIVRASFAKRRKTLLNALSSAFSPQLDKQEVLKCLTHAQVDYQRRGETCSLEEFAELTDNFYRFFQSQEIPSSGR